MRVVSGDSGVYDGVNMSGGEGRKVSLDGGYNGVNSSSGGEGNCDGGLDSGYDGFNSLGGGRGEGMK